MRVGLCCCSDYTTELAETTESAVCDNFYEKLGLFTGLLRHGHECDRLTDGRTE